MTSIRHDRTTAHPFLESASDAAAHRQLRQLYLQPRAFPRRTRRGDESGAQRRADRRRGAGAEARRHRPVAWALRPRAGGHLRAAGQGRGRGGRAASGRLPRPPVHRRGVRRAGRRRRRDRPRQARHHPPRGRGRLRRPPLAPRGHPLSFARRRARHPARRARGYRGSRRRHDHGAQAPRIRDRGRSVPPREHRLPAWPQIARELPPGPEGAGMSDAMKPLIYAASEGPLSRAQAEEAFHHLFEGAATPAQIGGFLMALRARGEAVAEYAAAASVMRDKCLAVKAPEGAMDIVGTGGDGMGTLNISTATAFVVAGAGVPVAKHGNRNLSSKSGAADVQSALGIDVMVGAEVVERALAEVGIGFMMAPMHHPAMKHVMPVRMELGCKTIFNILGPLTNPAGVKRQLTGAFAIDLIFPMAETLAAHGSDEISISGPTSAAVLKDGKVTGAEIHPEDAGLPVHPFRDILGGTPEENAAAFTALLGGAKGAYRDAVCLNAAAALVIAEKAADLKEGAVMAAESIDSGAAKAKLEGLARITRG